jgi:Fe/S biogenesis protein NfuA
MARMTSETASPILTVTDDAMAKVLEVRASEPDPESLVLWVEVSGQQAGAYTYLMEFRTESELDDDVAIQHHDDVSIAIPADSVDLLRGATLELSGGGMVMQNPNRPAPVTPFSPAVDPNRPPADLSGEVPQRVVQVLEQEINPAIAAHGGYAELVAVEGSIAYLRLSGGCQGCGLASVTLSQGIEVAILDSVPEITEVIDVTDHASGDNPFYEAAKK